RCQGRHRDCYVMRLMSRGRGVSETCSRGDAMTLHAELPSSALQAQFYRTNSCAQCSRKLLAPESIEQVSDRIIRYLWSCEVCGHQFETSVYLAPPWHCYA